MRMESIEDRRRKKVNAERLRRHELNNRLELLRTLLGLEPQLTRIQVLDEAATRLEKTICPQNIPQTSIQTNSMNYRTPLPFPSSFSWDSTIDTFHKISDVCLLDHMIHLFTWIGKHQRWSRQPETFFRDDGQGPRQPLIPRDMNVESHVTFNSVKVSKLDFIAKIPKLDAAFNNIAYWRPWESNG